ncbi:MAG: ABC transporter substrate-binding protein [Christensenellales bacterium]|jgi:peptide/nickel transport system substrate-binding protein
MRKLSILLVLAFVLSGLPVVAGAEVAYSEAPMLAARVESGDLPPVEERLPVNPRTADNDFNAEELAFEIGTYGGTLRMVFAQVNWNPDVFVGMTENLLSMQSMNSEVIEPNLVEAYEISDDLTTYTFTLRDGLKWSNGVDVTMDDVKFAVEHFIFHEELTPTIASWMCANGIPFEFEAIDDRNFQIKFSEPYGAFTVFLASSGFNGYSDFIKPAYYLKPFHIDFAEEYHGSLEAYYAFIAPFGSIMGYDDVTAEGVWAYVLNQIDLSTWEITDPNDCLTTQMFPGLIDEDFPQLYPWIMVSSANDVQLWERNPYYHKIDSAGNQLPYIDYLQNSLVQDVEMVQLEVMTGNVDFLRESATVDNVSLYRENAENANINSLLCKQGNTPTDLFLNVNYGLNPDGTVKEDESSMAWQEVIGDVRFRNALSMAVDADEILDAVYHNLGKVNESSLCRHEIDAANALLDEMGMLDTTGDGYRETPSGLDFQFQIWNAAEASDIIPTTELYVEFFSEIGIKASGHTTESSLLGTSVGANEVPARCIWAAFGTIWYFDNSYGLGSWAPLWHDWYTAGCPEDEAAIAKYVIPADAADKEFIKTLSALMTNSVDDITGSIRPDILQYLDDNCYVIRPISEVSGIVVLNDGIRNVSENVITHAVNYFLEDMFFAQ